MYWLLLDNKGLAAWNKQPLSSPRIFKIDLKNNSITNVLDFGDVDFYLEPQFPYLYNAWIHAIVFLGSDKTGKWIHIYKCRIE